MKQPTRAWLVRAIQVAIVYAAIGIGFGALRFSSHGLQTASRLLAWLLSGAAFLFHAYREAATFTNTPWRAARHVSRAVVLGAFLLAAWINIHNHLIGAGQAGALSPLAILVIFPLVTGVPAFFVAVLLAFAIQRAQRGIAI